MTTRKKVRYAPQNKEAAILPLLCFEGLWPYYSLRGVPLKLPELAFGSDALNLFSARKI